MIFDWYPPSPNPNGTNGCDIPKVVCSESCHRAIPQTPTRKVKKCCIHCSANGRSSYGIERFPKCQFVLLHLAPRDAATCLLFYICPLKGALGSWRSGVVPVVACLSYRLP
ncbi:hypothetical protein COCON_G00067130 [Conger conger]|uniref:Uncharacterized protein n=1 Tax=Conger conger TaxID=82655 RepID=A0A9Q1I2B9_CONCO|nr:hypothetical protein COCON_G00067130 [Conger conger]